VWGAAVDTLENTSRFAKGSPTGPMTVLHLFDQPLKIAEPYEGYMGTLVLPAAVVEKAAERSVLIDYLTPRPLVMGAIEAAYPGISRSNVHVWTLGGPSREHRLGKLWNEWRELGAHLVEDDWPMPQTGIGVFTESGTYAPVFRVGHFTDDEGQQHVFLCDGYAATAEAMQAASLDPILGIKTSMCVFSSKFKVSYERESRVMRLDPESPEFAGRLAGTLATELSDEQVDEYRRILSEATRALMPLDRRSIVVDDFFPRKEWRVLALAGYMLPDPYTGAPGVEQVSDDVWRVTSRAATRRGILEATMTLRLMEPLDEMRMVFSPLLDRFYAGQDFRARAVKISDSGRIRNELQTLALEAIEFTSEGRMRLHFDRVDDAVLPADKKKLIQEVLHWYKKNHPIWFRWLDLD
jgi:hypothetical protein